MTLMPDGSVLFAQDGSPFDRNGVRLAPSGNASPAMMADDSQSVCSVGHSGGGAGDQLWLLVGPVRGPMRHVAPAYASLGIFACSVASDRVVVGDIGDRGVTTTIRVLGLSTGRVLYQRSYAGLGARVSSSRDGRYLAEQTPPHNVQGQPPAAVTMIRRTVDGRVVAHIDKQQVVEFSWDGMRVVTASSITSPGPNEVTNEVKLVEWQTGKILWRQAGNGSVNAMAQPNGPTMAIAVSNQFLTGAEDQLWLGRS